MKDAAVWDRRRLRASSADLGLVGGGAMCGRSALYAALAQPDWMVGNEMVMHGGRRGGIFLSVVGPAPGFPHGDRLQPVSSALTGRSVPTLSKWRSPHVISVVNARAPTRAQLDPDITSPSASPIPPYSPTLRPSSPTPE